MINKKVPECAKEIEEEAYTARTVKTDGFSAEWSATLTGVTAVVLIKTRMSHS